MANAAIATVVSVVGKAYARNADGELRELRNGDVLVEGETVVNPDGGRVELSMTCLLYTSDAADDLYTV